MDGDKAQSESLSDEQKINTRNLILDRKATRKVHHYNSEKKNVNRNICKNRTKLVVERERNKSE